MITKRMLRVEIDALFASKAELERVMHLLAFWPPKTGKEASDMALGAIERSHGAYKRIMEGLT